MLFAIMGWIVLATLFGALVVLAGVVQVLWKRVQAFERRLQEPSSLEGRMGVPTPRPLQGVRIAIDVTQDHPHPVFASLLKEALLREDALPGEAGEIAIVGSLVCNGYAEVYYRAELAVRSGDETLLTVAEKPPHGDRPENLAREIVARLKTEMAKRERQSAIRELRE